jgi:RimJ/RimL family protein N-acetyltransferase
MKIKLVPFTISDFDLLLSWVPSERELRQWAGPVMFTWPLDKKQLAEYLSRTQKEYPQAHIYKAIGEKDGTAIGHIEFDKIDWTAKTTVLSRVMVASEYRGNGFGNNIIEAALNLAFNILNFNEIKLAVYTFNIPAIRCYETAGFETINFIKDSCKCGSENWDTKIMSISRSNYD